MAAVPVHVIFPREFSVAGTIQAPIHCEQAASGTIGLCRSTNRRSTNGRILRDSERSQAERSGILQRGILGAVGFFHTRVAHPGGRALPGSGAADSLSF